MFSSDTKERIKANIIVAAVSIILFVILINFSKTVVFIKWILSIASPFFIAIGIAYVLNLLMKFFEDKAFYKMDSSKKLWVKKAKRPLSLVLSYVLTIALLAGIITFIIPDLSASIKTLTENIPSYASSFQTKLMEILDHFEFSDAIISKITEQWSNIMNKALGVLGNMVPQIFNVTVGITSGVINFFIGLIASIYLLNSKEKLLRNLKKLLYSFVPKKQANRVMHVCKIANKSFSSFISGQIIEAFILGTLCFIGMSICRFKYALLISVIVGATGLIPIFGAFLGAAPGAILLFVINPWQAFWFIVFIIVLQQIEGNLIYPRVVGTSIGLSGLWVMVAMIIGGGIGGLLGILIGIPSFSALYVLLRESVNKRLSKRQISIEGSGKIS